MITGAKVVPYEAAVALLSVGITGSLSTGAVVIGEAIVYGVRRHRSTTPPQEVGHIAVSAMRSIPRKM